MKISCAAMFICLFLPGFLTPAQSQTITIPEGESSTSLISAATNANPTTTTTTTSTSTTTTTTSPPPTTSSTSAKTTHGSLVCLNGGAPSNSGDKCLCPPNYVGKTCEVPLKVCQNGGILDSVKCVCAPQFYGDLCQYPVDGITVATFSAEVAVEVTITNQEFNEQLTNNNTQEYKVFEINFKAEMKKAYRYVPGFKSVQMLSIRSGSIIVDHRVFMELEIKPSITIQEYYNEVVTVLKEELKVFIQSQSSCNSSSPGAICFSNSTSIRQVLPPTETELCRLKAPANFSQFYFPHVFGGSIMSCVTHCNKGVPDAINCNYGECKLLKTGPQCFCSDSDTYWYEGDNCSSRINKIAVYAGCGAAMGVLLVVIITLSILFQRSRKKHYQDRSPKESKEKIYSYINEDSRSM